MNRVGLRFNIYLCLGLAGFLAMGGPTGCRSGEELKKRYVRIRCYLEVNPDASDHSHPITIGRKAPFVINVERNPILTEMHVEEASLVEALGGFQILIKLNPTGRLILEQYSIAEKGKRLAVLVDFGEPRWLAAPMLKQRISNGELVFTPDATREEAELIVDGINRAAKRVRKGRRLPRFRENSILDK